MLFRWAKVLLSLAAVANAMRHPGPKATPVSVGFSFDGWTPKPTSKPQLELFKRQDIPELCGFFEGDPNYPALCDYGSTCLYASEESWFGCCTGTVLDDCNFKTACVQSATEEEGNSYVTYCTDELYPYCLLYQSIQSGSTFSHFGCADTRTTVTVLPSTTDDATFIFESTDDFFFTDESTSSTRRRPSRSTSTGEDVESSVEIESSSSADDEETTSSSVPRSTGASTTAAGSQSSTTLVAVTTSSTAGAAMQTAVVGAVGGVLGLLALL